MIDITRVRIPASTPSAQQCAENILAIAICDLATLHGIRLWTPKRARTSSIEPYRMEIN